MWKIDTTLKPSPIVTNESTSYPICRFIHSNSSLDLNNSEHIEHKLVRFKFKPIISTLFNKFSLYTYYQKVQQNISEELIDIDYTDILYLGNEYGYFYDESIYSTTNLDTLYVYTDSLGDITLTIDYSVSNIRYKSDLYFLAADPTLTGIYIQQNLDKVKQTANLEFLQNYNLTDETIVTFTHSYTLNLIGSNTVLNNTVTIDTLPIAVFPKESEIIEPYDIYLFKGKTYKNIYNIDQLEKRFDNDLSSIVIDTSNYYLLI